MSLVLAIGLAVTGIVVTAAPVAADPTGTGGQFVPLQTRLIDTRTGIGGVTGPMAGGISTVFTVSGAAGLPATGVAAIVADVTVVNTTTSGGGLIDVGPNTGGSAGAVAAVLFDANETVSNTVVIENGDDGKIGIIASVTVDYIVDVQGYFTTGNGSPAPGGFVSLPPGTVSTITAPAAGSTTTVQVTGVTGVAGVPSTATAVYANLTVDNTGSGSADGWLQPFAANLAAPGTSLNFDAASRTSLGTVIDVDSGGRMKLYVNSAVVSVKIDVLGYFDGQASNAGYTPLTTLLYDSAVSPNVNILAGTTIDVPVNGVGGIPAYSASISGVAMTVETLGSTAAGAVIVWPSDATLPTATTVEHDAGSSQANTAIVRPGTDGKVKVKNTSASGSIRVILNTQGYFTNTQNLPPAAGLNRSRSGSRGDAGMITRGLSDRVGAEINPTNGNLLLTQSLLNLTGVGPGVSIGVRYNSGNDARPTLNMGLFEAQLYRNGDGSITYTDPKGTAFDFVPAGASTFTVPKNINAHLTRTVDGSPSGPVSAGATYELVFHPSQVRNTYVSDGNNLRLTQTADITGSNKIIYTYAGGVLTSLTDTQGRVVNFGYTATPNPTQPTTITDTSLSRTITLAYAGPQGALSKVTDATGKDTTWAYDTGNGRVKSITDGRGSRTDFTYTGSDNKLLNFTVGANNAAVSGLYSFAYSTGSTVVTDPNSHTGTYQFDDPTKVITQILDGRGKVNSSQFNGHGDLLKSTTPTGDQTIYDVATSTYNLTKVTSPTGGAGGTGAAGRTAEYTFPTAGGMGATADYRPTSSKDAEGNTTAMTYNTWGQTATTAVGTPAGGGSPAGGTWSYKYQGGSGATASTCGGKTGQVCQVTDGKGNVTGFAYDTAGNLTTMTPPAGLGAHTFTYDAAGRKISEVDGKATTTYTCYDKNDRVLQVSTTSSNCAVASGVTYTFDAAGNATTRKGATGTATFVYDAQNRPTSKTESAGSYLSSAVTYDRASNVLTSKDAGTGAADTTTYTYDPANNLASLAVPSGTCPATPVIPNSTGCVSFAYDDSNRRTETRFPSGVKNSTVFDPSGRPTSITATNSTATVLVSRAYTYTTTTGPAADTSLVGTMTDQAGNTNTYTYDSANRLTNATTKNSGGTTTGAQAFTFDLNGNRTQRVITGTTLGAAGTTNYGYNAADQLCWSGTGTSGSCTAPGGATAYTYDGQGNQTSAGNSYNGFDQLTATTTGGALAHTYGGSSNNERTATGGNSFTNNVLNQVSQEATSSSTTKYIRDPEGALIGMQDDAGANYYYTLDNVSSVLLLTTSTQTVAASYTYDPYGVPLTNTGTSGTNNTNHYRYATGYTDPSGLIKLGARYYNPVIGRFTQPDPSGQETNRYLYAGANPTTYNDPSGLSFLSAAAGVIVGGIVGAATLAVAGPAVAGAVAGGVGGFVDSAVSSYQEDGDIDWGDAGEAAATGALYGLVGYGLGAGYSAVAAKAAS